MFSYGLATRQHSQFTFRFLFLKHLGNMCPEISTKWAKIKKDFTVACSAGCLWTNSAPPTVLSRPNLAASIVPTSKRERKLKKQRLFGCCQFGSDVSRDSCWNHVVYLQWGNCWPTCILNLKTLYFVYFRLFYVLVPLLLFIWWLTADKPPDLQSILLFYCSFCLTIKWNSNFKLDPVNARISTNID